jgi:hypothetical protein
VFRVFRGEERGFYHERHETHEKDLFWVDAGRALVCVPVRVLGGEEKARVGWIKTG